MMTKHDGQYNIDESDLGVDYQDSGPWRSYGLESYGYTIEELFENALVYETDQDGGELGVYSIDEAEPKVYEAANNKLSNLVSTCIDDILLEEEGPHETSYV